MNYFKNIILFSTFSILCHACEKQSIENIESKTAVVEGFLHANQFVDSLKITQSFSYAQTDLEIITLDNLEVTLSDFDTQYTLYFYWKWYLSEHQYCHRI